jgi:hypothetical protein
MDIALIIPIAFSIVGLVAIVALIIWIPIRCPDEWGDKDRAKGGWRDKDKKPDMLSIEDYREGKY